MTANGHTPTGGAETAAQRWRRDWLIASPVYLHWLGASWRFAPVAP
jgi:hypothetical protein